MSQKQKQLFEEKQEIKNDHFRKVIYSNILSGVIAKIGYTPTSIFEAKKIMKEILDDDTI